MLNGAVTLSGQSVKFGSSQAGNIGCAAFWAYLEDTRHVWSELKPDLIEECLMLTRHQEDSYLKQLLWTEIPVQTRKCGLCPSLFYLVSMSTNVPVL